jgi:hypothetical protein
MRPKYCHGIIGDSSPPSFRDCPRASTRRPKSDRCLVADLEARAEHTRRVDRRPTSAGRHNRLPLPRSRPVSGMVAPGARRLFSLSSAIRSASVRVLVGGRIAHACVAWDCSQSY